MKLCQHVDKGSINEGKEDKNIRNSFSSGHL